MKLARPSTLALVVALSFSKAATAGLVNSPPPVLDPGASARVIYLLPGVTKNNNLETVVVCTNLEKSRTVKLAVEVFDADGSGPLNIVDSGDVQTLPVGGTVTIATGATAAFSEDDIVTGLPPNIRQGSGRIVSTSKKIACAAYLVDEVFAPPTSMVEIPIINRKQQGD